MVVFMVNHKVIKLLIYRTKVYLLGIIDSSHQLVSSHYKELESQIHGDSTVMGKIAVVIHNGCQYIHQLKT